MLELVITNEQEIPVNLFPETQGGVAKLVLAGSVEVIVESGDSTARVEPGEKSVVLRSADVAGVTVIRVQANANLGEGEPRLVSDTVRLTVVEAEAAVLRLVAGTPVAKT